MSVTFLYFDPDVLYQSISVTIDPDDVTYSLEVELRYLEHTDKWYLSIFDMETGEAYCRYVPLVSSYLVVNDLLGHFSHKRLGTLFCCPVGDKDIGDPKKDNLDQFYIVWSDQM